MHKSSILQERETNSRYFTLQQQSGVSLSRQGFNMWLKDTSAAAGVIWNWWTHSRNLTIFAASLLHYLPIHVEPLSSGSGWMPCCFIAFIYLSVHLPILLTNLLFVFCPLCSHKHRDKSHLHLSLSFHCEFSLAASWPGAEIRVFPGGCCSSRLSKLVH